VAISYLVRRLEENAESDNFLSAAFHLHEDETLFDRERDRFLRALERAEDRTLRVVPHRSQNRQTPVHESLRPTSPSPADDDDLAKPVLDSSRGSDAARFVETAVYSRREVNSAPAGAPGFTNTTDSDPALPANREWAHDIRARIEASTAGQRTLE